MHNTKSVAKKVVSVIVAFGMIISMFACMSGLSVFAVDNTPAAKTAVVKAPVKATETTAAPKFDGVHSHCICGATHVSKGNHTSADVRTWTAWDSSVSGYAAGIMPQGGLYYLTEDITITSRRFLTGGTFVCLNGHTVTFGATRLYEVSSAVAAGKFLLITDCQGTGKIVHDKTNIDEQSGVGRLVLMHNKSVEDGGNAYDIRIYGGTFDFRGSRAGTGGMVYIQTATNSGTIPAHKIQIYGGTFTGDTTVADGNTRAYDGGMFYLRGNMGLYVYAGTFTGGKINHSGGIAYLTDNATATITGGTLNGSYICNTATWAGGNVIAGGANTSITVSGGTLTNSQSIVWISGRVSYGGVIQANGNLTISGSPTIRGTASFVDHGNAIYCAKNLNITGTPTIYGRRATYGCAISLGGSGISTINMSEGGTIEGHNQNGDDYGTFGSLKTTSSNGTQRGGAIYVSSSHNLTIGGGTITGSPFVHNGGTIGTDDGGNTVINITGGTINGGELYYTSSASAFGQVCGGTIYSKGALNISGGTVNAGTIAPVQANATANTGGVTTNIGACIYQNNTAKPFTVSGGTVNGCTTYVAWGNTIFVYGSPTTISNTAKVYGGNAYKGGALYLQSANATISLTDGGLIDTPANNSYRASYGNIFVDTASTLTVNSTGGTIGGRSKAEGGAIWADTTSVVDILVGTISGGVAPSAGNIYTKGTLNISGGTITGGSATSGSAGNIRTTSAATLNISGNAMIKDGTATLASDSNVFGGNILSEGNFSMTGGTVKDGTVTHTATATYTSRFAGGGNIFINTPSPVTASITGGTVSGGHAASGGNILLTNDTTLTVGGNAVITAGTASNGGNVTISGRSTLNMEDSAVISNGAATSTGGNILGNYNSNLILNDNATISGGTAGTVANYATSTAGSGGNVYGNGTQVTLNDNSVVSGGVAYYGGCITINSVTQSSVYYPGNVTVNAGATIKEGQAVMGGNVCVNSGATLNVYGTVKDGSTVTTNAKDSTRGGNINLNNGGTVNLYEGGVISGGTVGTYKNGDGSTADSFGGGNVALCGGNFNMTGGTVKDGGSVSSAGGNFSGRTGSSVVNISGGTVENGYSKYRNCGNFHNSFISNTTYNISGTAVVNRGTGIDAAGKYYGGGWVDKYTDVEGKYSNGVANTLYHGTFNVTGGATINDVIGSSGPYVEFTSFTGTASLANGGDQVISSAWDADYIEAGSVTPLAGTTHHYDNGVVTILTQSHADNAAAVDALDATGDVHLADRDAILEYNTYNATAKGVFEAQYDYDNLDSMTAQAEDYATMTETKVAVQQGFGTASDKVLYVIYSSMDDENIADYDYAQIILTINGTTKGNDAEGADNIYDVYRNVYFAGNAIASADDYTYENTNGHEDKSDYIYYTTLSLTAANAARTDVEFDFFVRIYLVGGGYVDGSHVTGKLADLLS